MRDKIVVYQKPTCSKCTATRALLEARGVAFETVNYYDTPLTVELLRTLVQKLRMSPSDLLRRDVPIANELGLLRPDVGDDVLLQAMAAHPDLMQRPIVVRGEQAVLGRPPENVNKLL